MEEQRNIQELLGQIPQPGFLVQDHHIQMLNQAASVLQLVPGQDFLSLLASGADAYGQFLSGQLCLTLTIAGKLHAATILKMGMSELVLLEQQEELEEFRSMALVSMQMRKPLMQAIANARQLEEPASAKMNQSLMQMLRLVSNMSDISRYQHSVRMEVRDVDSFLLELFEKAQTLVGTSLQLSYEGLKYPLFTRIDPEQLERAIWNILSNSIRFLPQGGTIAAKLTRREKFLYLTVEDSGSGIAEHVRADLFRRYLRQPGIEDSRYGLGLGLAIVRTVVSNHGGTLLITNSGAQGGTRITMTLALQSDDSGILRSPLFLPDYAGGFDHGLVELSDCLDASLYQEI